MILHIVKKHSNNSVIIVGFMNIFSNILSLEAINIKLLSNTLSSFYLNYTYVFLHSRYLLYNIEANKTFGGVYNVHKEEGTDFCNNFIDDVFIGMFKKYSFG